MLVCDYGVCGVGVMSRRGVFVFLCERGAAASYGAYPPDGSYNERFNTCCGVVRVVFLLSGRCAGYMCGGFCGVRYAGGGRSRMPGPTPPVIRARVVLLCRERACESAWAFFLPESGARAERALCSLVMVKPTPLFKFFCNADNGHHTAEPHPTQ